MEFIAKIVNGEKLFLPKSSIIGKAFVTTFKEVQSDAKTYTYFSK